MTRLKIRCFYKGKFAREFTTTDSWHTLGSSKENHFWLPHLKGFHLAFEFYGEWKASYLFPNELAPIDLSQALQIGEYTLEISELSAKKPLFSGNTERTLEDNFDQFFVVKKYGLFLESHIRPKGKTLTLFLDGEEKTVGPFDNSASTIQIGNYEITCLPVQKQKGLKTDNKISSETKQGAQIALSLSLVLMTLSFLFGQDSTKEQEPEQKPYVTQLKSQSIELQPPAPKVARKAAPSQPKRQNVPSPPVVEKTATKVGTTANISKMLGRISKNLVKDSLVKQVTAKSYTGKSGKTKKAAATNLSGILKKRAMASSGGGTTGKLVKMGGSTKSVRLSLIDEDTEITGGLDKEVIANYIKSHLGQILYCYERQLSANPDLFGKVQVKFEISADGSVDRQKVQKSTLSNRLVENCILKNVSLWNFPKPRGGTRVVVTYPLLFKSTN